MWRSAGRFAPVPWLLLRYWLDFVYLSHLAGLVLPAALGYILSLLAMWIVVKRIGRQKPGWCQNRASYTKEARNVEKILENQFGYVERHLIKYFSLKSVYPASLHPSNPAAQNCGAPIIFCIIPHGVLPLGLMAYPVFSKWFNDRICRWTTAPVVLAMPFISQIVKAGGFIAAKKEVIEETLSKKDQNVGVVLDGIAGMFNDSDESSDERGHVMERKGIVKIALKTGATIIPVYQFGITSLWTIVVDPFGLLERVSCWLNISFVPFYGRWGWPLGPPRRRPLLLAFGEPLAHDQHTPEQLTGDAGRSLIDAHHKKLVAGFQTVFNTHKAAFGWGSKNLQLV